MTFTIDLISDFACPWCFIGQTRLFRALESVRATRPDFDAQINWLPFFLDPSLPPEGESYPAFLRAKFGTQAQINTTLGRVIEAGKDDCLAFDFDRIQIRPNTLQAHRLCYHAQSQGEHPERIKALTQALFSAHFQEGRDISNPETLADIAIATNTAQTDATGTDSEKRDEILAYLASETDITTLTRMEGQIRKQGISGVPFFIFNRRLTVSGAQSPATLGAAILQAASL